MKIYLILILIICLTEQLKADVYRVDPNLLSKGNKSLTIVDSVNKTVTFVNDVNQEDMKVSVVFIDFSFNAIDNETLDDPCNMDPSTHHGTLATILWKSLGIDCCPISAGEYKTVEPFMQIGIIEDMFDYVNEIITIAFEPKTQDGQRYFKLFTDVRLVKGNVTSS